MFLYQYDDDAPALFMMYIRSRVTSFEVNRNWQLEYVQGLYKYADQDDDDHISNNKNDMRK